MAIQELVVVFPTPPFPPEEHPCDHCNARKKMQQKYINQIKELFEDFHIVELPALDHEIRGIQELTSFSENLVNPKRPQN